MTSSTTSLGSGIYIWQSGVVTGCYICGNQGNLSGGGIYMDNGGEVFDCYVAQNTASDCGAGVYIKNGKVYGGIIESNTVVTYGGGIYCEQNGFITNSAVRYNNATSYGGGIYADNSKIVGCSINQNKAYVGGGANINNGTYVFDSTISNNFGKFGNGVDIGQNSIVSNCNIIYNYPGYTEAGFGGGVFLGESNGEIKNSKIAYNIATWGGGAYLAYNGIISKSSIVNNQTENEAYAYGAGIVIDNGGVVFDCLVTSNSTPGKGGGIYIYDTGVVSKTIISWNSAGISAGGVLCDGGGSLTNCLIGEQNQAPEIAGVYLKNGGALYNCTIAGNYASGHIGGICTSNGGVVVNTIIYDNTAIFGNNNWKNYESGAAFTYCCTTPTNGLPGVNECIPADPLFVSSISNYHLTATSPCINSGVNMPWMTGATDLDGNPRIHFGTVDMGCYELIPEPGFYLSFIFGSLIFLFRKIKFKI